MDTNEMEQESKEKDLFEKYLHRTNKLLRVTGMDLKDDDGDNKSLIQRLRHRWFYCFNIFYLGTSIMGQIGWYIEAIITDRSITEITYFLPCVTFCCLGNMKGYYFMKHSNLVCEVVNSLRKVQNFTMEMRKYRKEVEEEMIKNRLWLYNMFTYFLLTSTAIALLLFMIGPFLIMGVYYYSTGKILYTLPFFLWYPVDQTKLTNWPFLYLHQIWSGTVTVFMVFGPDNFFATCSTFINIQFHCLQYDIEKIDIGTKNRNLKSSRYVNERFRSQFEQIIHRHKILISLVNLLESIYTKSTLFNVATSSLIICVTGFNITTIENKILMMPFISFFFMSMIQVVVLCYYGDKIMQYSEEISDAVYKSQWYFADAAVMKDLLFLSIRSRKACKLTAYQFTDINLNTFGRIMGRSWSYFALLQTVYGGQGIKNN
ncbi:putative odorant receptor 92a [Achroia grisella]|uniref:putative odorant receptor 92a n=1 Tax=Achroia grisella TaxID=688607 RepID=UPI0027D3043D|nr:putative odorant receptor 92a [Achroia grisella]